MREICSNNKKLVEIREDCEEDVWSIYLRYWAEENLEIGS